MLRKNEQTSSHDEKKERKAVFGRVLKPSSEHLDLDLITMKKNYRRETFLSVLG